MNLAVFFVAKHQGTLGVIHNETVVQGFDTGAQPFFGKFAVVGQTHDVPRENRNAERALQTQEPVQPEVRAVLWPATFDRGGQLPRAKGKAEVELDRVDQGHFWVADDGLFDLSLWRQLADGQIVFLGQFGDL